MEIEKGTNLRVLNPEDVQVESNMESFMDNLKTETDVNDAYEIVANDIITESMIKEEKRLEEIAIREEQELKEKMLKERKEMLEEQCLKRLNLLLSRSSIYSKFMSDKIERQKAKLKKKEARNAVKEGILQQENVEPTGLKRKSTIEATKSSKKRALSVSLLDVFQKESSKSSCENEGKKVLVKNVDKNNSSQHPTLFYGGEMRSYQIEGYDWLKVLYENGVNGILGDEMGLGKTIQSIAFIAHLIEMGVTGPFFVCGPLSTLPNWVSEFKRFTPDIPVLLYYGSKDERKEMKGKIRKQVKFGKYSSSPVVITSFQTALIDSRHLYSYRWKLMIIDEAHRIKNFQCKLTKELKRFDCTHRLLLTGTPLQNSLSELWSLLNFILPEIFDDLQVFESWFDCTRLTSSSATKEIIAKEQEKKVVSTIHEILTPFFLRRTKADVELSLPKKKEVIVHAPLTNLQQEYYTAVVEKTIEKMFDLSTTKDPVEIMTSKRVRKQINYKEKNETDFKDDLLVVSAYNSESSVIEKNGADFRKCNSEVYVNTRNSVMILRKICCHPYLISYPLDFTEQYKVDIDLVKSSGKFLMLDSMLPELKKRGHKVLIFSQFTSLLAILEDYCLFREFTYNTIIGSMSLPERQQEIQSFNENDDSFLFLISTKAGGLGINLTKADTVIVFDSDWNPQNDLQAQDRCHRIGQTKPVVVYRLVVPHTVDERIIDRAVTKRKLEKAIIQKGRFCSKLDPSKSLNNEELLELLESSDFHGFIKTEENNVISEKELLKLLDRSDLI